MLDFKRFRRDNKMTQVQAASYFGVTQAFISQMERGESKVPEDLIDKIKADESLNKSSLEVNKSFNHLVDETPSKVESNAVLIENPNFMMVSVVGQYAAAGYMSGYADPEYLEELPKVPFFVDHEAKGKYMGFDVRGDSMDDGSHNSIMEGDTLICRQIKPELWHHKLHIQKWYFVIVHRTEGIIVKQIIDHNTETGDITIHSLNDFYPDRVLNLRDVAQLFNVVQVSRKPRL